MSLPQMPTLQRDTPAGARRPSPTALLLIFLMCAILLTCVAVCRAGVPALSSLTSLPAGERWFSVSMNDERRGFGYLKIAAMSTGYEVVSEGSVRMVVLGFTRQAASRERYLVNRDLSLKSFVVEEVIDGQPLRLTGDVTARGVRVVTETPEGTRKEKLLKVKGAIYPSPVLNLYPLTKGVTRGRQYRLHMLDVEEVKVKEVTISALGRETLPGGVETVHLRNDLYPFVDNDVWVDLAGNTVRESVRDDLIVTRAEDAHSAAAFIAAAALAKKDLILDFSLIRVPPLARPREARKMTTELSGVPGEFPLLEGAGQVAERLGGGMIRFTTASRMPQNGDGRAQSNPVQAGIERYLAATAQLPSDKPAISALRQAILGDEKDQARMTEKLVSWTATQVKESDTDSPSPLVTLDSRSGDSLSHARLYATLARSAGIPTRVVAGIVYTEGKGFLYHSWAESYLGGWVTVDPTFGSVPADATHIRLIEGDAPEDLLPLAILVGRVTAKVLEVKYGDQESGTGDREKTQPIPTGP
jgi:transglutaminase-like putative cysteine protease